MNKKIFFMLSSPTMRTGKSVTVTFTPDKSNFTSEFSVIHCTRLARLDKSTEI